MTTPFLPTALLGKSILVTGASSGIGRASATLFSQLGARLSLVGRSPERLNGTLASLAGTGHSVHPLDVGDIDASVEAFQAIARNYGPYHGIFHSAGAGLVRPARLTKQEHFQAVLAASVGGTFAIARFASMKNMLHDRSSVVFMSSVAGHRGQAGMALYSASKGAIDAATRSLACELAPRAIRVNSIVAGAVTTEMHERMTTSMPPEAVAEYEAKHLLGFGTPSDVASVVAYLLSDAARWITGSAWVVDGGYLAQ